MKKAKYLLSLSTLMVILAIAPLVMAQDSGFGAGIMVGEPTGISLKSWLNESTALDAGATWSFTGDPAVHIHADYLLHNFGAIEVEKGRLPWYYGIGGRIQLANDPNIGARIPVGLNYWVEGAPIDVFFEVAPTLDLIPDVTFDVSGGLGVRYFFSRN
ncbi:MAG: hypothetical protein ACQETE_05830 [Bacteroidota bacterium]